MDLDDHADANALSDIYKGYIQDKEDESIIYVFLDFSRFKIRKDKTVKRIWATVDEIYYCRQVLGIPLHPTVGRLFEGRPSIMYIKDKTRDNIEIPSIMYLCELGATGSYKNVYNTESEMDEDVGEQSLSLIDDRIDHPVLGNFYYFSTDPLQFTGDIFNIRRFVGVLENPLYVLHPLTDVVHKKAADESTIGKVSSTLETTFPNGAGSIIPNIVSYFSQSKEEDKTLDNEVVDKDTDKNTDKNTDKGVPEKIQADIKKSNVVVFIDPECPYCKDAIKLLTENKTDHIVIECDSAMRNELKRITSVSSVPSIWIKGEYIGGLNDGPEEGMGIKSMIENGDLAKRLTTNPIDLENANKITLQEEKEEEASIEEQIGELANVNNPCIYFQEIVDQERIPFWCMKSKLHFSEI
jgi:glutaredoxin-related protein